MEDSLEENLFPSRTNILWPSWTDSTFPNTTRKSSRCIVSISARNWSRSTTSWNLFNKLTIPTRGNSRAFSKTYIKSRSSVMTWTRILSTTSRRWTPTSTDRKLIFIRKSTNISCGRFNRSRPAPFKCLSSMLQVSATTVFSWRSNWSRSLSKIWTTAFHRLTSSWTKWRSSNFKLTSQLNSSSRKFLTIQRVYGSSSTSAPSCCSNFTFSIRAGTSSRWRSNNCRALSSPASNN